MLPPTYLFTVSGITIISYLIILYFSVLEKTVQESAWYRSLTDEVRNKVSFKLYELVPKTCAVKYNIPNEDKNIKEVQTFKIMAVMRGGNHREISVTMYSITIGQEVRIDE